MKDKKLHDEFKDLIDEYEKSADLNKNTVDQDEVSWIHYPERNNVNASCQSLCARRNNGCTVKRVGCPRPDCANKACGDLDYCQSRVC